MQYTDCAGRAYNAQWDEWEGRAIDAENERMRRRLAKAYYEGAGLPGPAHAARAMRRIEAERRERTQRRLEASLINHPI